MNTNTLENAKRINKKIDDLLDVLPGSLNVDGYNLPFEVVHNGTDTVVIILTKTADWSPGFVPGNVVLARRLDVTWDPWVTWFRRKNSTSFHCGHYFRTLEEAVADFERRS